MPVRKPVFMLTVLASLGLMAGPVAADSIVIGGMIILVRTILKALATTTT